MRFTFFLLMFFLTGLPYSPISAQLNSGELPAWFFKPENFNRINRSVGISQPGLDTSLSIQQAKYNALIINSILHDASFTSLTSVGIGNQTDEKTQSTSVEYILFTGIIRGTIPSLSALKTIQENFTTYKEAFILFEMDYSANHDLNKLQYTIIRRAGFQKENLSFPLFLDELEVEIRDKDSIIYSFCLLKEGPNILIRQKNKVKLFFDDEFAIRKNYFYPDYVIQSSENASRPIMSVPLHNGLWNAFLFNLIDQVCIFNSMDINLQFKLSTLNLGNNQLNGESLSFQQLVYSLKNIQTKTLNNVLSSNEISGNQIRFALHTGKDPVSIQSEIRKPGKSEKKELKKLIKENWQYLGEEKPEIAWLTAWQKTADSKYITTEVNVQANSLHSGIIEGMQLAKLQLSSMLAAKITSRSNVESGKDNIAVKSAKLINVERTGSIGPYYIFYQNSGNQSFNIRLIVLYDLEQLKQ